MLKGELGSILTITRHDQDAQGVSLLHVHRSQLIPRSSKELIQTPMVLSVAKQQDHTQPHILQML